MRYIFRSDSSLNIGSGHLMRCLNMAKRLKGEVIFICRKLEGNINSRVLQNQFKLIELPYMKYEIENPMEEVDEILPFLKELKADVIIVDHYGLDKIWEKNAKKHCNKLVAIDDLNRKHEVDAIIDQNFYLKRPNNYIAPSLFIGPEFCLLNSSFEQIKKCVISPQVKNILVFFGGSDLHSMSLKVAKIVKSLDLSFKWHFVLGSQNQDSEKIQSISKNSTNITLHTNIDYMAKLMSESDIFIGAGGTTSWERAKLGLPSLIISVAKNQKEICHNLHKANIISYLGNHASLSDKDIINSLDAFTQDYRLRLTLHKNSLNLKVGDKLKMLIDYLNSDI